MAAAATAAVAPTVRQRMLNAARDYREAFVQLGKDARAHPLKTALWVGCGSLLVFIARHTPDERDYEAQLTWYTQDLGMLSEHARSRSSYNYLMHMGRLRDEGRLRVYNFGLFSLLVDGTVNPGNCLVKSQTFGLRSVNPLTTLRESVQDVGWMDRWYHLERNMVNYDVCDD